MMFADVRFRVALCLTAALTLTVAASTEAQCDAKSTQCASEAPAVDDAQDLIPPETRMHTQYLFSTPLIRTHISAFAPNVTAFNNALSKAILEDYNDFLLSNNETDPQQRNDDFYGYQAGFGEEMTDDEMKAVDARAKKMRFRNIPEFATLKGALAALGRHAVHGVLRRPMAEKKDMDRGDEHDDRSGPINIDFNPWAAVHYKRAKHTMHFHEDTSFSAVYYVSVPNGSGELTLYDPRGPRPPFEHTFTIHPQEGDLIMFPGWLGHSVGQTGDTGNVPRISIPFNGEGVWEQTSYVPPEQWSVPIREVEGNMANKE